MFDKDSLVGFLIKAKKSTYATGDQSLNIPNADGSKTLVFEDGDWRYHDNYFGGEPYGGREVVFYQEKPVYMMVYYGFVKEDVKDVKSVYSMLQEALRNIPATHPFRGPASLSEGNAEYRNDYIGDVDNFSGEEIIEIDGEPVYSAKYAGGLVDVRN